MNRLIAIFYFVLSLYGCDVGGSTQINHTTVDRHGTLDGKAIVRPGVARFDGVSGGRGRCHYSGFPAMCAPRPRAHAASPAQAADNPSNHCMGTAVGGFATAAGKRRCTPGRQDIRRFISSCPATTGPDCEPPQLTAAR